MWKDVDRKELDVSVLNLLLSLTDQHSVLRGYTIRPELANIPQKGQVLKSNIGTIVTNRAKWEEVTRENSQLRKKQKQMEQKDQIMEQKLKEKEMEMELRMLRKQLRQTHRDEGMEEDLQGSKQKQRK